MIVRILGEGQLEVADDQLETLNELDRAVESTIESGDEAGFRAALTALLDGVRRTGTPLAEDSLEDSDLILPPSDATIDEVRQLLDDDGLIPGSDERLMARTRFVPDTGLTVRMTSVMFLLGALFVALVVGADVRRRKHRAVVLIGVAGIGVAFFQWWSSDKVAMRAMRAREVTPEQAPELHGMIDRLCAMADMPKPRVAIADTDLPNAFATGRSPEPLRRLRDHRHPAHAQRRGARGGAGPRALPRRPPRRAGDDRRRVGRDHRRAWSCGARSSVVSARGARQQEAARSGSSSCWWSAWSSTRSASCCCGCSRATASSAPTAPAPT